MYNTIGDRFGFIFNVMTSASQHLNFTRVIAITWALGLSLAIPPLIGWAYYSPEPNGLRYIR